MTNSSQPLYPEQQQLIITLDIVPEDPSDADIAWMSAIQRDTEDALQHDGYTIRHPYTGTRGGPPPVELLTTITQAASYAWDHHTVAEEVVSDMSALVTIFVVAIPPIRRLFQSHQQRASKEPVQQSPIKITIQIDDSSLSVEAPDVEQAEAALKLAKKYHISSPNKKITAKSKVNVRCTIPKRKSRRRR